MYPTMDRDVKILLNPTDIEATAYDFAFSSSDNTPIWGLAFGQPEPYVGKMTTATRAATTSATGLWILPRNVQKIDLADYQDRPDYVLQFKKNDADKYLLSLTATSTITNQQVKSPYVYTFTPKNVNDIDMSEWQDLKFNPSGKSFVWGVEYAPVDSALVYDYYLEIDKSKTTDYVINTCGIEIVDNGYKFIAKKEAAVHNTVYFKYNYILINGKKGTLDFGINFNAEEAPEVSRNLGNFTAPFNAVLESGSKYVLTHDFPLADFFTKLGATGKQNWIDALARNIGNVTDPKEIYNSIFDKKFGENDREYSVELLGGDPNQ